MMWQEARKQEKQIKSIMVDYKRRAERRHDYYERIKQDPIKFLRIYGRPSKLHLDTAIVKAAENPNNMMPWLGDPSIMIDRFDVRANLEQWDGSEQSVEPKLNPVERIEERICMYERYRCLIHNDYARVTEEMALKQIDSDEKYGDSDKKRKDEEAATKKSQEPKAAIGFTYTDSTHPPVTPTTPITVTGGLLPDSDNESDVEADSDMDIDVELDLATLGIEGRRQLAISASLFGLHATDFVRLLTADQQLETELRLAKALEEEKLQLAGRKSRRVRRYFRERRAHDKMSKTTTTKIGLLNGQPISRRTVYLSASSSDSGDYPSDVAEDEEQSARLDKASVIRDRRARAKPLLTNARGPSVLIGGMTSISLCRRRANRGLDTGERMRKAGARSSSSSSSDTSVSRGRRRSSSSSCSSPGSRSHHHGMKRSKVEYITTFGEDNAEESSSNRKRQQKRNSPINTSTSHNVKRAVRSSVAALSASAVSKVLSKGQNIKTTRSRHSPLSDRLISRSGIVRTGGERIRRPTRTRSSSSSGSHHRGRRRSSPQPSRHRRGSRSSSRTSSSDSRQIHSTKHSHKTRSRSRTRYRSNSIGRSTSRSPLSRRLADSNKSPHNGRTTSPTFRTHLTEPSGVNPSKASPPLVQKRYYRPELESNSELDEDEEEDKEIEQLAQNSSLGVLRAAYGERTLPTTRPFRVREDSKHHPINVPSSSVHAGKMTSSSTPSSNFKSSSSATPRPTPQELLQRRVQSQLTRAFNDTKKAELEKQLKNERERQVREEGLRRQADLIRRQEQQRRRAVGQSGEKCSSNSRSSSSSSSSSRSSQSSRDRSTVSTASSPKQRHRSRSRSVKSDRRSSSPQRSPHSPSQARFSPTTRHHDSSTMGSLYPSHPPPYRGRNYHVRPSPASQHHSFPSSAPYSHQPIAPRAHEQPLLSVTNQPPMHRNRPTWINSNPPSMSAYFSMRRSSQYRSRYP